MKKTIVLLGLIISSSFAMGSETYECKAKRSEIMEAKVSLTFDSREITTTMSIEDEMVVEDAPCQMRLTGNEVNSLACTDETGEVLNLELNRKTLDLEMKIPNGPMISFSCEKN